MDFSNAFIGQAKPPTESEVSAALGSSKTLWDTLVNDLEAQHKLARQWNCSSKKLGWSLRLKRADRNIVYLAPCHGCFRASFALGDKAVQSARTAGLPPKFVKLIDEAKRYAEGTAVRIDVHNPKDADVVKKLAAIKLDR